MKPKNKKVGKNQPELADKDYKSLYEAEKCDSISKHLLYESIQNKNSMLCYQNKNIGEQLESTKQLTDNAIANLNFHISVLEDRNRQLIVGKRQAQIKHDSLKISYDALINQFNMYKSGKEIEVEQINRKNLIQKKQYQKNLLEHKSSIQLFQQMKQHSRKLEQELRQQKQILKQISADKDCEKILTVDAIKKQMMKKAYQMRNKAAQIRKSQLDTTTRLTFLQNDQLVRQLQYQSSNTEKILKKNEQLSNQIKQLKRTIEVHQQVEKQITKRNVYAKKYIKNLLDIQQSKPQGCVGYGQSTDNQKYGGKQANKEEHLQQSEDKKRKLDIETIQQLSEKVRAQQTLIHGLQQRIRLKQVKKTALVSRVKSLRALNRTQEESSQKMMGNKSGQKKKGQQTNQDNNHKLQNCEDLAVLLSRFYDILMSQQNNQTTLQMSGQILPYLLGNKLEIIKNQPIQQWPHSMVASIVNILLSLLKPYLNAKTLKLYSISNDRHSIDYQQINNENFQISKYVSAMKRIKQKKQKQNNNIKGRSLTHLTSEFQRKPLTYKHKLNSKYVDHSNSNSSHEIIAGRFMKNTSKAHDRHDKHGKA